MKNCRFISAVCAGFVAASAQAQTVYDLDEVVVSAGEEKVASEVPQAVSVVDQEELDALQPSTVGEALSSLPGVTVAGSSSFFGQSINIRGVGSGAAADEPKIIMLVDGQEKYYEQYRMGSLFVDTDLLKRVEVLRGPGSSTLYGTGAMGGVVSMETKEASDFLIDGDTFAVRQKFAYQSNGNAPSSTTIFALAPDTNTEVLAAVSVRHVGTTTDGDGEDIVISNALTPSFLLKGSRQFGDSKIPASYQHLYSTAEEQDYNQLNGGWGIADRDVTDQTAQLTYEYAPLDNPLVDLTASVSFTNTFVSVSESDPAGLGTFFLPPADFGYKTLGLKLENTAAFSGNAFENYLTVGAAASWQRRHGLTTADFGGTPSGSGINYHPEGLTRTLALYAQNELVLNDRLTVIAGARLENQTIEPGDSVTYSSESTNKTVFEPQIAALYKVNDSWNVFGSATLVNRLPTVDEMYDIGSAGIADPALGGLDPEEGLNLELGFSFAKQDVFRSGDSLTFKTTAFHNKLTNLIGVNPAAAAGVPYRVNINDATIQGVELEGRYATERFYSALGVSIIEGEDANGTPLSSIPGNEVSIELGATLPQRGLAFGVRSSFVHSVTHGTTENDGYDIHNVYASWKPDQGPMAGAELTLGVDNIFDTQYQPALYGSTGMGRNFKISLAKTF